MPPAVIGGGLAAVGAIGGAVIGSKAQKSAANQANASQQAAMEAQLQLGRESMDLNRDIYNSNYGILSPFVSRGNVAGDQINALLGLGRAPVMTSPLAVAASTGGGAGSAPNPLQAQWNSIGGIGNGVSGDFSSAASAFIAANQSRIPASYNGPTLDQIRAMSNDGIPGNEQAALQRLGAAIAANNPAPAPAPARAAGRAAGNTGTSAQSAQQAFQQFADSAGMKFQQQEAANAINQNYAGAGTLQSGAAMKAISDRSQQVALNNYFLPYMSLLGGQQAVGAQGAAAVAGVGSNFGNTAANINGQMGGMIQNGANAASNAAIGRGLASSNMWAGIGSSFGNLAGSLSGLSANNNLGGYDPNAYGGWS